MSLYLFAFTFCFFSSPLQQQQAEFFCRAASGVSVPAAVVAVVAAAAAAAADALYACISTAKQNTFLNRGTIKREGGTPGAPPYTSLYEGPHRSGRAPEGFP